METEAMEAEAPERFRRERSSVANLTRINLIINLRYRRSEVTVFTPFCLFVGPIRRIALIIACVCLSVCVCVCLCVCLSVVHPPSAQVLQSILIKLGHMDHWGT